MFGYCIALPWVPEVNVFLSPDRREASRRKIDLWSHEPRTSFPCRFRIIYLIKPVLTLVALACSLRTENAPMHDATLRKIWKEISLSVRPKLRWIFYINLWTIVVMFVTLIYVCLDKGSSIYSRERLRRSKKLPLDYPLCWEFLLRKKKMHPCGCA